MADSASGSCRLRLVAWRPPPSHPAGGAGRAPTTRSGASAKRGSWAVRRQDPPASGPAPPYRLKNRATLSQNSFRFDSSDSG